MFTRKPEQHFVEATVQPEIKESTEAKALAESLAKALNKPKDAPGAVDTKKERDLLYVAAPARIAFGGCSH